MENFKSNLSSIRTLVQQLRVPEMNYQHRLANDKAEIESIEARVIDSLPQNIIDSNATLVKQVHQKFPTTFLSLEINNLSFLIDRIFDVYLRKNNFSIEIKNIIDKWRFPFFKLLYSLFSPYKKKESQTLSIDAVVELVQFIDMIISDNQGWSESPKRSQSILLNELQHYSEYLFDDGNLVLGKLNLLTEKWQQFNKKQSIKFKKVTDRLILQEEESSWQNYCQWIAQGYINNLYAKHNMPDSLRIFISNYWVNILAQHITFEENGELKEAHLEKKYELLSRDLYIAFCRQDEKAFKLADHILEDLQQISKDCSIIIPEDIWMSLELSLLTLLKKEHEPKVTFELIELNRELFTVYGNYFYGRHEDSTKANFKLDSELAINDWFCIQSEDNTTFTAKFIKRLIKNDVVIFSNYLGIKNAEFSTLVFTQKLSKGVVKHLPKPTLFSDIFSSTIKGLIKVADAQQKARIAAAEKAKAEAESLLEARQKSEQLAIQKADEIALRTKSILKKRADKLRIDLEAKVLEKIEQFKVGAWIALKEGEEKQRFKLVVKLAATSKFIFVDKLGVRKREFYQQDLISKIINNEIEILSDGAEFEDSLERVVSRLRMSK